MGPELDLEGVSDSLYCHFHVRSDVTQLIAVGIIGLWGHVSSPLDPPLSIDTLFFIRILILLRLDVLSFSYFELEIIHKLLIGAKGIVSSEGQRKHLNPTSL